MADESEWVSPSGMVRIRGDEASITAETKTQCRACEKELRLVRQQLVVDRRAIDTDIRELRARWKQTGNVSGQQPTFWGSLTGSYAQQEHQQFNTELIGLQRRREFVISRIEVADRIILAIKALALELEQQRHAPSLPSPKFCSSCGASIEQGTRFCGQCGARI